MRKRLIQLFNVSIFVAIVLALYFLRFCVYNCTHICVLFLWISCFGQIKFIEKRMCIISIGARVDCGDEYGYQPLYLAAGRGHHLIIRVFYFILFCLTLPIFLFVK